MKSATRHAHTLRGFTLIELLTVIAIIGILAAIIIPTVTKVRSTAKNAQCMANLREWGRIIMLYANDNKGNYYTLNWASVATNDAPMGRSYQPYFTNSRYDGFRMRYCPSDPETPRLLENTSGENPRYAMVQGAVNGTAGQVPTESPNKPAALPLMRASSPSRFMLMIDSTSGANIRLTNANLALIQQYIIPLTQQTQYADRHGSSLNALWGDGSVRRVTGVASGPGDINALVPTNYRSWFQLY